MGFVCSSPALANANTQCKLANPLPKGKRREAHINCTSETMLESKQRGCGSKPVPVTRSRAAARETAQRFFSVVKVPPRSVRRRGKRIIVRY